MTPKLGCKPYITLPYITLYDLPKLTVERWLKQSLLYALLVEYKGILN